MRQGTIKGQVLNHLRVPGGTTVNQSTYISQALVRCLAAMLGSGIVDLTW